MTTSRETCYVTLRTFVVTLVALAALAFLTPVIAEQRRHRMLSRALLLSLATAAALAVSSVALAGGGLSGKYVTTIKSPAQLKGKWAITFAKGGTYTVALNGETLARGRYASTANTITLDREQGSPCTGAGTYAWKKSGRTLTFARKRESASCQVRAIVLSHRFTQAR